MNQIFSIAERRSLAQLAGIGDPYLYQCLSGRREMGAIEAMRVERATNARLRRWHVCPKTWHLIWPELRKHKLAPAIATELAA